MATESLNRTQQIKGNSEDDNRWCGNDLSLRRGLLSEQFSVPLGLQWQSRQASGGQMRQHSERRKDGPSPAVAVPAPTPTDDGDGRRLLNIDLSVEAPEQE
ncbi:hypothetical protein BAE44_0022773 [Dichanthelium oligosanthes]|uniref:Uncharacterized protein n=1 Tax=Dichanthelium oligosanthes TaxID=888268 RepID=A0A1E5UTL4_9POAL|nr:hypothetical protein BAE44_0022773 [Dichanthelium oligosanthes]